MRRIVLRYHKAAQLSVLGLMLGLPVRQSASAREGTTEKGKEKQQKELCQTFTQRVHLLRWASLAVGCFAASFLPLSAPAQQGLQPPLSAQDERAEIARAEPPSAPARGVSQPGGTMLTEPERFNAYYQATYVYQNHAPFRALYSGPNSLSANHEKSYTFTATGYFGLHARSGGSSISIGRRYRALPCPI